MDGARPNGAPRCSGTTLADAENTSVIRCDACGYAHLWPLPATGRTVEFHEAEFYDELKPTYRDSHQRDREWWDFVHDRRLQRIEQHRGQVGRLLDIGSGYGDLIARAQLLGWEAIGVEPSVSAAKWANDHGRPTACMPFSENSLIHQEQFDAIIFDQSIEHISDPVAAITRAVGALSDGGLICIVFANDFSPTQAAASEVVGANHWWVAPNEHLNYFSLDSMKEILSSAGAHLVDAIGTFPIDLFLTMGFDYVQDSELGRSLHERRMRLEFAFRDANQLAALESAYRGLAQAGLGREIEVIAGLSSTNRPDL